jgi:hypothetical protein
MSCTSLNDALVDVARGRDVGPGSAAAVETHVEHCGACAAALAREQRLSDALRGVASMSAEDGPLGATELERRLLEAFAQQRGSASPAGLARFAGKGSAWMRIAAAALLAIGTGAWWQMSGGPGHRDAGIEPGVVPPTATAPQPPASKPVAGSTDSDARAAPPTRLVPQRARPPRRPGPGPAAAANEFVLLPGAAGLPDFESGEIVRMELPLPSLPAYGIEIGPDVIRAPVEADVLIGQDGQARAIRLVTRETTRPGAEQ